MAADADVSGDRNSFALMEAMLWYAPPCADIRGEVLCIMRALFGATGCELGMVLGSR